MTFFKHIFIVMDAWGKWPEGFLSGHVNAMGDFDECVDLNVGKYEASDPQTPTSFAGIYCNTYLAPYTDARFSKYWDTFPQKPTPGPTSSSTSIGGRKAVSPEKLWSLINMAYGIKLFPSVGVCFPNSCDQGDIEQILMNIFYSVLYDYPPTGNGTIWPAVEFCYVGKRPDFDAGDISVIALLGAITGLVVLSSVVDIWLNRGVEKPPKRGVAFQCLNSFSLYTNVPRWLSTRATADDLGCLHGIRFLSTAWVILGHTWFVVVYVPYWNLVDVKMLQEKLSMMTIFNCTVSVDTFFVLSGLLVAYNVLKMLAKTKGKLNIPMFYIHRYLRLTPVYAAIVGVMATLVPYAGRGPYWFIMERWSEICEDNWWTNMLYVNNFVNTSWLCQGEAWYLADDMQFYIISPLFLLPLYHWEMIGVIILAIFTVLSTISPILLVHYYDTAPTTIGTKVGTESVDIWYKDIYIKPYARIQTYFVGMWLGYILFKTKGKRVKLPYPIVALFWAISTVTALAVLYGIQDWFDPLAEIPKAPGLMYAGFSRFAWGISVAWIIFACVKGYGGLVNDFLSWKVFMPLGRLCYCAYLISLHLQMILHVSFKQPMAYSEYSMLNFFFAHMVMSFLVGFFFTLTIETPFMQLEKILFEGGGRRGVEQRPAVSQSGKDAREGIFYNSKPGGVIVAEEKSDSTKN
ncbi:nose resistant to fluoxetine protein 6 [Folsomia candida]|uniref:nose resistant to fluoxetine protein 6 n=1 Tax=Folsomia candida TaxID=158441 RepID=UPI001604AEA4|nr:nose resistant to fluoxetine protein 6 [Folsomia candida]